MTKDKMDEQILVIARETLFNNEENVFQGYKDILEVEEIDSTLSNIEVKRRGDMEEDVRYKQLIPYVIVEDVSTGDVLVYERLQKAGETRLHGSLSIGVGGHANDIEGTTDVGVLIKENALRELQEELIIGEDVTVHKVGLLNDDSDEVGEVHFGIIYVAKVSSKAVVECGEPDQLSIGWATRKELQDEDLLENWSKVIVQAGI